MPGTSDNERLSTTEVAEEGTVDETQQSNSWSAVFMFVPFIFLVILLLFVVIEWARPHSVQLSGGGGGGGGCVHSSCVERHPAVEIFQIVLKRSKDTLSH